MKYNDTYNMTEWKNDDELLDKVKTGKGDEDIYTLFKNIYVDNIFGGTVPADLTQDSITGRNDIERAFATSYSYLIDPGRRPDLSEKWFELWELGFYNETAKFNEQS